MAEGDIKHIVTAARMVGFITSFKIVDDFTRAAISPSGIVNSPLANMQRHETMVRADHQPGPRQQMLVIIHSGQTGVERGAHRAAITLGVEVAGFMPLDKRDELGPVPRDVAAYLTSCFDRGPRPAVRANVALASGAMLVVPDAATADKFTAMGAVIQAIRSVGIPYLACDPLTNLEDVTRWVHQLPETSGSTRLLVTGPRATRWPQGETLARRIVGAATMSV